MLIKISRMASFIAKVLIVCGFILAKPAGAKDMSAVDFNGDLLGKVIPDGTVIDIENYAIGHITPEGFVVNDENNIIGGIIPQGVAISTDNKILGKVNNDGSVTSINDSLIGKVLPNGLITNYNYDVIGAVIVPGLVYNDAGNIIGRVAGDGKFYNLSGENNGFVASSGHVFTISDTDKKIVLAGRLLSSNKIISSTGNFLGGMAPDGAVIDLNKKTIGKIHANGFAYNPDGAAIGHIVENGFAFNLDGSYMGTVGYDGGIANKGQTVAQSVFDNRVIGKDGNIIGFTVSMSATANDFKGKYLGRITLNGMVVKGRDVIGKIGASGNVIDSKGEVIGFINQTGPIFDYLGQLKGYASINGSVYSMEGVEIGYMQKNRGFALKEKEIGRTLKNILNYDNNNNFIGISGIDTKITYNGKRYTITPYGYVFDENGVIEGKNHQFSSIFSPEGNILTNILSNGKTQNLALNDKAKVMAAGYLLDSTDNLLGKMMSNIYATDFMGKSLGFINSTNLIADDKNILYAKILPTGSIMPINSDMPQNLGRAGSTSLSVSINGDYLGVNTEEGLVKKTGELIGKISSNEYIIDNQSALYGKVVPFGVVTNENCKFIGVISDSGDVRNLNGAYLGMVLANEQVINDTEEVIGHVIVPHAVSNDKGEILGVENPLGVVFNYKQQNMGCRGYDDKVRNSQNEIIGQMISDVTVMDFNNKIIGYTDFKGRVVDNTGREIGYVSVDGSVKSIQNNENIGILFRYTVAFDKNNIYMGRVNAGGEVVSDEGAIIGKVLYNGAVETTTGQNGFALYDLYVYDNEGKTVGYIAKNGRVYGFMNGIKGAIYNGFVLDKKQNLIARGLRDYDIRNDEKKVIGHLGLDGVVTNSKNIEVGTLRNDGAIVANNGEILAIAQPLQYYHMPIDAQEEVTKVAEDNKEDENLNTTAEIQNEDQQEITEQQEEIGENNYESEDENKQENESSEKNNIVGIAIKPDGQYLGQITSENQVVDEKGNVIAAVDENGNIKDSEGKNLGTFENKGTEKPAVNKKDDWINNVIKGVTVSPYDNTDTVSHVGADGGIGPRGRYNPRRAAIINSLQNERRKTIAGKVISNNNDISSYTGWQDRWDNASYQISSLRVDMSNMITSDKPIPAILARSVISLGDAPVTAIVERNVYGDAGRNVIIPAGSRVIGGVENGDMGQERFDAQSGGLKLEITWRRIIRPDGIAFDISSSQTGDAEGRGGGALGYVDEQLIKKYAVPLMGTVATSAIAYMMAANEDATGEVETSKQQAASDARQSFLDRMNQVMDKIIESKEQIQAVTYIPAGTRVIIYPMTDLWLRTTKNIDKTGDGEDIDAKKDVLIDENAAKEAELRSKQEREQKNNGQLSNSSQNSQGNNKGSKKTNGSAGSIPPPSADGTGATVPDDDEDDDPIDDIFEDS